LCRSLLGFADDAVFPDDAVEALVTCAVARDSEQALALAAEGGPLEGVADLDARIARSGLWAPGGSGGAAVLRRLLLRRLAARPDRDPDGWVTVHEWLRDSARRVSPAERNSRVDRTTSPLDSVATVNSRNTAA